MAGIAAATEKAAALSDLNRMMKTRSEKVQITMGLPYCPRKINHAILDTGAVPNLIRMGAIDEFWRTTINIMNPQELRSAAGTYLRVVRSVPLVTKIEQ